AHNEGRLGKTLRPGREDAQGEKVQIIGVRDSDEEARIVGGAIERLHADGHPLSEMAILMRAGFQTRPFEERLMTIGIPYRIVGGLRFYERSEIRDCLAYMRVLSQPSDDLAFERIINVPKRGVGAVAVQKLHGVARTLPGPLTAGVLTQIEQGALKGKSKEALTSLMEAFQRAKATLETEGQVVAVEQLLEDSGYLQMWRDDRSVEAPGRLDNIRELLRAIGEFATLEGFLEHVALVMDTESETSDDKVSLMTLHGSKGLEFDTVFLPGWEEGVFPSQRSLDEGGNRALEEERRLAYVGLTRARLRAIVVHAASRRIYANWQASMPSRFIEEIPSEYVQTSGQSLESRRQAAAAPSMFASGPFTSTRRSSGGPQTPRPRVTDVQPQANVPVGATVFHQKFGEGTVVAVDGSRLEINFENGGIKRVMANFVEIRS
ncbi:ATP-dependent helicase, partial [Gluconobacter cerinus]